MHVRIPEHSVPELAPKELHLWALRGGHLLLLVATLPCSMSPGS